MADLANQLICASDALTERGRAVRFRIPAPDGTLSAFVVRYRGQVYGYLNLCCHIPVELDEGDGDVFDLTGHYLLCGRHGARYLPESGLCIAGPCQGRRLTTIITKELNGMIYYVNPAPSSDQAHSGVLR